MKIYKYLLLDVVFFLVLLIVQPSIAAEDFPLSIKGWQATVIRLEGVNTSKSPGGRAGPAAECQRIL